MTGAQDWYVDLGQYQLGSLSISQKMKGACVLLGWEVSFFFSRQYELGFWIIILAEIERMD